MVTSCAKAKELNERVVPPRIPVLADTYTGIGNAVSDEAAGSSQGCTSESSEVGTRSILRRHSSGGRITGREASPSETLTELDGADSVVAAHPLLREEPVVSNDTQSITSTAT